MDVPDLGSGALEVVARSAIVYLALLMLLRFGGKRQIGQLSKADLVLVLLIANGVQNAMVGENVSVIGGLLAAGTLIVIDQVVDRVEERSDRLRTTLEGEPVILVRDGTLITAAMAREGVTKADVMAAIRAHGLVELKDVGLTVLETTGSISVIPRSAMSGAASSSTIADAVKATGA
jgi:uncharacterized membrane protein YcaP (DUF421 family)